MQIAPSYEHETKNVYNWTPFDYLHWLLNIQDSYKYLGCNEEYKAIKAIADSLFERIKDSISHKE